MVIKNCLICGKEFKTYECYIKNGNGKFCSKKCSATYGAVALNKKRWGEHKKQILDRICSVCGKTFTVHKSDLNHRPCLFCSMECRHKSKNYAKGEKHYKWKGGKQDRKCIVCGKSFKVKIEQIERTGAKFCSQKCRGIHNIKKQRNFLTDIEQIMFEALFNANISFKYQENIKGIALVDFLINNNLVVQCDGTYWHNLPKQIEKDKKQNNALIKAGYKLIRFSEKEIKTNIDNCIELIKVGT